MKTFPGIVGDTFRLLDGHNIPLIGLGTYELWNQKEVDIAVNAALENGYRLFDTANFYANEKELGNAFAVLFCFLLYVIILEIIFWDRGESSRVFAKMIVGSGRGKKRDKLTVRLICI